MDPDRPADNAPVLATTARGGAAAQGGLLLVLAGPSGVGKTSIAHALLRRFSGVFSVSATTRAAGPGEQEGVDYTFVDRQTFQRWIAQDRFLETALVYGRDYYGTLREPVDRALADGKLVILDIDVQGAAEVRRRMPVMLGVFILPPSDEELLRRLRSRARESEEQIERRFAQAHQETARARQGGIFDALIVNTTLEAAIAEVAELITARMGKSA